MIISIYQTNLPAFKNMKSAAWRCLVVSTSLLLSWGAKATVPAEQIITNVGSTIPYVENKGQWPDAVAYRADVPGGTVFLEKGGFTYALVNQEDVSGIHPPTKAIPPGGLMIRMHALKVKFLDAEVNTTLNGGSAEDYYSNYFIGSDPSKWASYVKSYKQIIYAKLYDGVNMTVYSEYNNMKYDFIVAPLANTGKIRLEYNGADAMRIVNGDLMVSTTAGVVTEKKPYAFQVINGRKITVPCNYSLTGNVLGFLFPNGYNVNFALIIDPNLIFSTLTGSTGDNWGFTASYDDAGNFYTGGVTLATGYPVTPGAYQTIWRGGGGGGGNGYPFDVAISKYNPTGTTRIYATYLGGADNDFPSSFVVNKNQELFVLGRTYSSDFPTTVGALQRTIGGAGDIFVTRFNAAGSALIGSTFIGGANDDGMNISANFFTMNTLKYDYGDDFRSDIILDANDNVYVASCSRSVNFPTLNPFQAGLSGAQDGVVFKLNNALTTLQWSSYIGGNSADGAYGINLDNAGNVLVTGGTTSANFPVTAGTYKGTFGGLVDGWIAKIPGSGGSILHATYLGTSAYDQSFLVQVDQDNNIYVAGQTQGVYPVSPGVYSNPGSAQFIQKFDSTLTTSIFSTVIGTGTHTAANMSLTAFLVDVCGNLYLAGWGRSCLPLGSYPSGNITGMPITANAFQKTTNGCNFYFIELSRDAQTLLYGTYFGDAVNGEEHVDGGTSRFDKNGIIYESVCAACGGYTNGFPTTPGVVSPTSRSNNCNNGSIKMQFDNNFVKAGYSTPNGNKGCPPATINFTNNSVLGTTYFWDFGDGDTSSAVAPTHIYKNTGTYTVRLISSNVTTCNVADTTFGSVVVYPHASVSAGPDVDVCSGASDTLNATGGPKYTYAWAPVTGLSNPNIANPVASPSVTTTYVVNAADSNKCAASDTIVVNISSVTATVSPASPICNGGSTQLSASGGTAYSWSPKSSLNNDTLSTPVANPTATTTYTVTVFNSFGCTNTATVTLTVNPLPTVTFAPLADICVNASPLTLSGGSPAGGSYSGPGVAANIFNPSVAGIGTHTLTYTYTDNNTCTNSATSDITVDPAGAVTINPIPGMCAGASPVTLSGNPAGGTFSGPGVAGNTFDPSKAGAGTHTITYTYNVGSCLLNTSATTTVTVSAQPSATIVNAPPNACGGYYLGSTVLTAVPSGPVTGYQWYKNGVAINGATSSTYTVTQDGWYNVIVSYNGCQSDSGKTGLKIHLLEGRCGHDLKKVILCHVPDCRYDKEVTICIAPSAVPAHLRNHPCDCLGPCATPHHGHHLHGRLEDAEDEEFSGIELNVVPNPFANEAAIQFFIPEDAQTTLEIFDIKGSLISKPFDQMADADTDYSVKVSGLAEGVYIARLQSGDFISRIKMVVTK